jgi:hypothetical protein
MRQPDEQRDRRLAEALRENLKRRKAQARGEGEGEPQAEKAQGGDPKL